MHYAMAWRDKVVGAPHCETVQLVLGEVTR
jgi:hypothetical protein